MKKLIFLLSLCMIFCLPGAALAGCGTCAAKAACGSCVPGLASDNPGAEYYGDWDSFREVVKAWNEYKTLKERKASSSRVQDAWGRFVAARRVHAEQRRQYIMNLHVPARIHACQPGCQKSCCKVKKCEVGCQKSCCEKRGFRKFSGKCSGKCDKATCSKFKKGCAGKCAPGACKSKKACDKHHSMKKFHGKCSGHCGTYKKDCAVGGCPAVKSWKKKGCSYSQKKKCGSSCKSCK